MTPDNLRDSITTHTHTHTQPNSIRYKNKPNFYFLWEKEIKMKNYFFKFLKKSFLTWAILALFFVHSFSFLTYADDTLFSIEWMNMSQYWWWWTSWDLEAILTRLAERWLLWWGWWWTWWVWWNWVYWWDWTTFNYAEREQQQSNQLEAWDLYLNSLQNQINTFQSSWSYASVTPVDLDANWLDEIITIDTWWTVIIYEWNWKSFKQVQFYWFDNTAKANTYFLRLEDENWKQIYHLILYKATTASTNSWNTLSFYKRWSDWRRQQETDYPTNSIFSWILNNQPLDNSFSNWRWVCYRIYVDNDWFHYSDRFKEHCWRTWYTCSESKTDELNNDNYSWCIPQNYSHIWASYTSKPWWSRYHTANYSKTIQNENCSISMYRWDWWPDFWLWWSSRSWRTFTTNVNIWKTMQNWWVDRYRLFAKKTWTSSSEFSETNIRYNRTKWVWSNYIRCWSVRNYSLRDYFRAWNRTEDYWFIWWKLFFKSDDWVKEVYNRIWNSQNIWWIPIYRFKKDSTSTAKITFNTATTTEKKPQSTWSTIASSEYDTFVTKANSDWTYNYKITLENPEWQDVIAFYWLNYNWIIFKDINWDWVKDIMTYENYVSEDNIQFKRVYEFIFDPSDYIYKKVLDWVDTLEYQWIDIDNDWDLDLMLRRYDKKLYMYKNNNLEDVFTNIWSVRWTYFLFKKIINNWKYQIITKNMPNNWVAWEWKVFNIDWNWYFNVTWSYENWLIWIDFKSYSIDSNTWSLFWILKEANKYKVVYYNTVTWLYENFPVEFYINDLTNSYITNVTWTLVFLDKEWNHISFYKNAETWKYIQTEVYYLSNWITVRATENAETWEEYRLWLNENDLYYIASNKTDIQNKITEWYDSNHIVTTKVSDITNIFKDNTEFNWNINSWDIEHLSDLTWVFEWATSFNKSISSWNTSNITNMTNLFKWATSYNQSILSWNMNKVSNITNMFNWATSYNQNLSTKTLFTWINTHTWTWYDTWATNWSSSNKFDLRTVKTKPNWITKYITNTAMADWEYRVNWTTYYVVSTKAQIQSYIWWTDISKSPYIITTKVTDMSSLFYSWADMWYRSWSRSRWPWDMRTPQCNNRNIPNANNTRRIRESRSWTPSLYLTFNWDISTWDTSNVTTMENMFRQNHCFNQDITKWDTSNVTNMNNMFTTWSNLNAPINKNLSWWNVTKVWANHSWFRCNWCTQPTWSA